MAWLSVLQSVPLWSAVIVVGWVAVVGRAAVAAGFDPGPDLRHTAVTTTADLSVGLWLVAAAVMVRLRKDEWYELSPRARFARLAWTLGLAAFVVHVVFAFWLAHGWSHAAAVRRIEEVGGASWGIVVNYLFAVVWAADVVWWWAAPRGYALRPRRVGYAVHGFLAFIVFNATVVFGVFRPSV